MSDQAMQGKHAHDEHIEEYGDTGILSKDASIPRWLIWTYMVLPVWGVFCFYIYWNGSVGWLDRGYWHQLQQAAGTTFPQENMYRIEMETLEKAHNSKPQENKTK